MLAVPCVDLILLHSCCFIKNRHHLIDAFSITPAYLQSNVSESGEAIDFRNWGVPLSRRFRALKIWFVVRTYGVDGFKAYIRNHVRLGKMFASLIASRPDLFKIVTDPDYALTVIKIIPRAPPVFRKFLDVLAKEVEPSKNSRVCSTPCGNGEHQGNSHNFVGNEARLDRTDSSGDRLVDGEGVSDKRVDAWITQYSNTITKEVFDLIKIRGEIMLTSTVIGGLFVIRVNGANPNTEEKHLRKALEILVEAAEEVLSLT